MTEPYICQHCGKTVVEPGAPAGLTMRQAECLRAIQDLTAGSVSPTYEEIGKRLGLASKSVVYRRVKDLASRGCIRVRPRAARSIEVIRPIC